MKIELDGRSLTLDEVLRVARPQADGSFAEVALAGTARAAMGATRTYVEQRWVDDEAPLIYSFNTGVGVFKDQRLLVADMAEHQTRVIGAHATGVGEPFPTEVVRAMMLLRANAFASNFSGPSLDVVDRLLQFLNNQVHPVVPSQGSVGASGDLAPLAHLAAAVAGLPQAEVELHGRRMGAAGAAAEVGLEPRIELRAKDASALINGTTASLAVAVLAAADARRLLKAADIALTMSLEAMRGELAAFEPPIHIARPHPGQARTARNVLRVAAESARCSVPARDVRFPAEVRGPGELPPPRVQDVYSLRCAPQVHGPVADALDYIERVLDVEINSATDNPLIFEDGDGYRAISGGNFHGQYIAQTMDLLAMAVADLGSISERRLARLLDPAMSHGLPRNLATGRPGLNTGFVNVQCTTSALVMENRGLSTAGSVDSIPGKGNAEDHVSNSAWCARKARTVVGNSEHVVAGELLCAAQALSLVEPLMADFPLGRGTRAALDVIRDRVPAALDGDRWFQTDMGHVLDLVRTSGVTNAVEAAVGTLE